MRVIYLVKGVLVLQKKCLGGDFGFCSVYITAVLYGMLYHATILKHLELQNWSFCAIICLYA